MQNSRETDGEPRKVVFATKIEDVIGGITLDSSFFAAGDLVPAGTPVVKETNGMYQPIKTARLTSAASNTATDYQVAKGHVFKVGDFVASGVGAKAYAITAINKSNADYDVITLGTTLGVAVSNGATLFQAIAESATTTSAFVSGQIVLTGHEVLIKANDTNVVDAYIRASVFTATAPPVTAAIKAVNPQLLWL